MKYFTIAILLLVSHNVFAVGETLIGPCPLTCIGVVPLGDNREGSKQYEYEFKTVTPNITSNSIVTVSNHDPDSISFQEYINAASPITNKEEEACDTTDVLKIAINAIESTLNDEVLENFHKNMPSDCGTEREAYLLSTLEEIIKDD